MAKSPVKTKTKSVDNQLGFKFFASLGRFSVRYRWLVVAVWIIALFSTVHFFPSLSSVTQSNNANFLPSSAPSEHATKLANVISSSDVQPMPVVVGSSTHILNNDDQQAIDKLAATLKKVSQVKDVQDRGRSPDGHAEELIVLVPPQPGSPEKLISDLRSSIASVNLPNGVQAHLAGQEATAVDNSKQSGSTNSQIQLFSALFIIVLLLLIFRAPLAPLITLIPPLLVVIMAGPVIAEISKTGLKVSAIAQLLLTVLVLGAGTDYGLFLIFRVKEELKTGLEVKDAVVKALSRVGESISFSAATVIAALLSLAFASFQIYSDLGTPLAIGVVLMLLAGITLLPALIAIFGRAVFWPSSTKKTDKRSGLWGRAAARIVAHPWPTLIVGVVVFVGLSFAVLGYQSSGFGGNTTPPAGSDSAAGNSLLLGHFPQNASNPTIVIFQYKNSVWQSPGILAETLNKLSTKPAFKDITGPLNPNGASISAQAIVNLHSQLGSPKSLPPIEPAGLNVPPAEYIVYRSLSAYISPDGHTVFFSTSLSSGDPSTTEALKAVPTMRQQVSEVASAVGATDSGVTGEAPVLYDISNISNHDLVKVIPIAIIVIGLILAVLMRSLIAPLYLIVSVILSYLAALGLVVIIFIESGYSNGIVFLLPFLMFIFLLALGEDYNILVMTRIREEAHDLPLREAVKKALSTTGTTVTSAGLVLAGTFAILAIVGGKSGGDQIKDIGYGLALGILMDTFLVRTLLVPSIVVLLGKWNWWPSKHGSWVESDK